MNPTEQLSSSLTLPIQNTPLSLSPDPTFFCLNNRFLSGHHQVLLNPNGIDLTHFLSLKKREAKLYHGKILFWSNISCNPMFHFIPFIPISFSILSFSLHGNPVSFSCVEIPASICHCLPSVFPHLEDKTFLGERSSSRLPVGFPVTLVIKLSRDLLWNPSPLHKVQHPHHFCCSGVKKSSVSFIFRSLSPSALLIFFSNDFFSDSFPVWFRMPFF